MNGLSWDLCNESAQSLARFRSGARACRFAQALADMRCVLAAPLHRLKTQGQINDYFRGFRVDITFGSRLLIAVDSLQRTSSPLYS